MRVLVVGSGGREHALAWKLKGSPSVSQVYVAPGNAGTALDARNVAIPEGNHRELLAFAQKERIDLVVIGPEAPLVAGLSDLLTHAGINVFGPSKAAAELEGSKVFCKRILAKANIPTAPFQVFERMQEVEQYLAARPGPCVVKVDGLAAAKGCSFAMTIRKLIAFQSASSTNNCLVQRETESSLKIGLKEVKSAFCA